MPSKQPKQQQLQQQQQQQQLQPQMAMGFMPQQFYQPQPQQQLQQQQQDADEDSEDEDDRKPLSRSYKTVGGRTGIGRAMRIEVIEASSKGEYTAMQLASMANLELDQMVWIGAGVAPATRLTDLRCKTKRDVRLAVCAEVDRLHNRYKLLQGSTANIGSVADQLGWQEGWNTNPVPKGGGGGGGSGGGSRAKRKAASNAVVPFDELVAESAPQRRRLLGRNVAAEDTCDHLTLLLSQISKKTKSPNPQSPNPKSQNPQNRKRLVDLKNPKIQNSKIPKSKISKSPNPKSQNPKIYKI